MVEENTEQQERTRRWWRMRHKTLFFSSFSKEKSTFLFGQDVSFCANFLFIRPSSVSRTVCLESVPTLHHRWIQARRLSTNSERSLKRSRTSNLTLNSDAAPVSAALFYEQQAQTQMRCLASRRILQWSLQIDDRMESWMVGRRTSIFPSLLRHMGHWCTNPWPSADIGSYSRSASWDCDQPNKIQAWGFLTRLDNVVVERIYREDFFGGIHDKMSSFVVKFL